MSDKTMREQFEEWYAKSYCPDVTAEHRMQRNYSWAAWQAALAQREAQEPVALDCYDAGLLNDFGGGNVEWWQDYIRAELARAHDFYQSQAAPSREVPEELQTGFVKMLEMLELLMSDTSNFSYAQHIEVNKNARKIISEGRALIASKGGATS